MYCFHEFFQPISLCLCKQPRLLIPPVVVQSSHDVARSKLVPVRVDVVTEGRRFQMLLQTMIAPSVLVSGA